MEIVNFTIDGLPGEWQDETIYTLKGPSIEEFCPLLILTVDRHLPTDITSVEQFAGQRKQIFIKSIPKTPLINKDKKIQLGDTEAWEIVAQCLIDSDATRYFQSVFALKNGMGLTFTCQYSEAAFRLVLKDVEGLMTAFLK